MASGHRQASRLVEAVFAALCLVATVIVICRVALAVGRSFRKWYRERLGRKFEALCVSQQICLRGVFESGSRDFYPPNAWVDQRWFEELKQWNYVEQPIMGFVVIADS